TTGNDGFFRDLNYPDNLSQYVGAGLKDTWMDARMVRVGTKKGDEAIQRAKVVLEPRLEGIQADLTGQRKKCSGPIEVTMLWRFRSALDPDSVLSEHRTTTTYQASAEHADEAMGNALRHAARKFSEVDAIPGVVSSAYGSALVRSKGSVLEVARPK